MATTRAAISSASSAPWQQPGWSAPVQQPGPAPYGNNQGGQRQYNNRGQRPYGNNQGGQRQYNNQGRPNQRPYGNRNHQDNGTGFPGRGKSFTPRPKRIEYEMPLPDPNEQIRLNKYMSNAGICSRREADEYIQQGLVKVNGLLLPSSAQRLPTTMW